MSHGGGGQKSSMYYLNDSLIVVATFAIIVDVVAYSYMQMCWLL